MEKRESHDTLVDMCPRGHGVWLDRGELERIQIVREWLEKEGEAAKERGAMEEVIRFLEAVGEAWHRLPFSLHGKERKA
jgi:Zn-finger nucleic acid-binding protein